jgi:hypothetical protein
MPEHAQGGPKVVYVMGAGRSGSTILGVALGNCEGLFYAGELDKWIKRTGGPQLRDPERMSFWAQVREQVEGGGDLFDEPVASLERSSSLLRPSHWRTRRRLRARYLQTAQSLYRAVARVSGASYVVDSSHYPLRAHQLQRLGGIELYLLYLVRDPRRVVESFERQDGPERRFSRPVTNAYLWLTHMVSSFVFLRHPRERRLLVRYEEFVADPSGLLGRILTQIGSAAAVPDLSSLRTGLAIQGNRLLREQVVAFKPSAQSAPRAPLTWILQLPVSVSLGCLRPRASPAAGHRGSARLGRS